MPRGETLQVPIERPSGRAPFSLSLPWDLAGDQPTAAAGLIDGLTAGDRHITLRGVTGSGKTVTMAKVIAEAGRPALVLAHNKTLAAQLYKEFKGFFPHSAVHYFVSYYDYYQPEAYIPQRDIYIEKDSSINENIDRLRLAATSALVSREDVIIVAFRDESKHYAPAVPAFARREDLLKVKGIGLAMLEGMEPYLSFPPPATTTASAPTAHP